MFEGGGPRVFGLPPGVDFAAELAAGVRARLAGQPPEALARVEIAVNAERVAAAVGAAFETAGPAVFLPRIQTLARFVERPEAAPPPEAIDRLERRLTLRRLTEQFLAAAPERGGPGAADPLAVSLARLIDEMAEQKVGFGALKTAADEDFAAHWGQSLTFLDIMAGAWPAHLAERGAADPQARRAAATGAMIAAWAEAPPATPVIAAGSTGSTVVTAELLAAIAHLPQGAVVLPGFDFALDADGWRAATEEHPQWGFKQLLARLDLAPDAVRPWRAAAPTPRARLWAEALRPAPATHAWRLAAPRLASEAEQATKGLTLVEAPGPAAEAQTIALIMRETLERGEGRCALVTPDRSLARRVAAALGRWGLEPDDSSGRPLSLTPPGVFLRMVASALAHDWDPPGLLALLKHPLTAAGEGRAAHLREVARLEREGLRNRDVAHHLTGVDAVLDARVADDAPLAGEALARALDALRPWRRGERRSLGDMAAAHRAAAGALAGDALWEKEAGEAAAAALERLETASPHYGEALAGDYPGLFSAALDEAGDVRAEAYRPHPRLAIWGPLEARGQMAERMILGGLNEGVWPAPPPVDPWLNRAMRAAAGLPAPERRIGLSAHDFLQAAAAPEAVLTRALAVGGAPASPARWLSRLETLLGGVAPEAWLAMRARGGRWVADAAALAAPAGKAAPATRPAPRPPAEARPRRLSVTEIETLIRDPYAIYAKRVLRLKVLDPPGAPPDARLRGEVVHKVVERLIRDTARWPGMAQAAATFDEIAEDEIALRAPPPLQARLWRERLARTRDWFLQGEEARREAGRWIGLETKGVARLTTAGGAFDLSGVADRIDRLSDGTLAIYDYKAGQAPSDKQAGIFAKQLPLLAGMAAAGAFDCGAGVVTETRYLSLSGARDGGKEVNISLEPDALDNLAALISAYDDPERPYLSRAAPAYVVGDDYDHLARFGEWDDRAPEGEA